MYPIFRQNHIPKKWQDDSPKLSDSLAPPSKFHLQIGGLQRQHFMLPVQQAQRFSELLAANVQVLSFKLVAELPGWVSKSHGSLVMSPLNITQPLGIWSFLWLLFLVMSNIPKMGHLPTPECKQEKTPLGCWLSRGLISVPEKVATIWPPDGGCLNGKRIGGRRPWSWSGCEPCPFQDPWSFYSGIRPPAQGLRFWTDLGHHSWTWDILSHLEVLRILGMSRIRDWETTWNHQHGRCWQGDQCSIRPGPGPFSIAPKDWWKSRYCCGSKCKLFVSLISMFESSMLVIDEYCTWLMSLILRSFQPIFHHLSRCVSVPKLALINYNLTGKILVVDLTITGKYVPILRHI